MIKNLRITYKFPLICFGMLLLFSAAATILNGIFFTNMLLYTFYQIFCMIIPGYAVLHLLRYPAKNQIFTFGFSLAIGYAISILTYIIAIPLSFITESWMIGITVLNYAIAAASLAYLVFVICKKRYDAYEESELDKKELVFFLLLWLGVFLLYFLFFGFPNRLISKGGEQVYYSDTLYWIGNALSLSRDFPPESMRGTGHIIRYHYFSSMHLVAIEKTLGVPIQTLALVYSYIQSSSTIVFGFYCLFVHFFKDRRKISLSFVLLLFSMGFYSQTSSYPVSHILTNPFGYDFAIGIFAFAILILRRLEKKETSFLRGGILYLLLLTICLGTKAPIAVIILVVEALLCLKWLIYKEKWYKIISFGLISVVLFLTVYLAFMTDGASWINSGTSTTTSGGGFSLSWKGTSSYSSIIRKWYELSVPKIFKPLLGLQLFFTFMFSINFAIMFLVVWRFVFMIRHRKQTNIFQWIFLATILIGTLMTLFIPMVGYSQIYFTHATIPLAIIVGMYHPSTMPTDSKTTAKTKWGIATVLTVFSIYIAATVSFPILSNAFKTASTGKAEFDSAYYLAYESNVITADEYMGYKWIEENTPEDSILITNATTSLPNPLMTNVFTDRRMFMESHAAPSVTREEATLRHQNTWNFMVNNSHDSYIYMCNNGVDYAIILTRFKNGNEYTKNLECIYSNAGIEIYKLH